MDRGERWRTTEAEGFSLSATSAQGGRYAVPTTTSKEQPMRNRKGSARVEADFVLRFATCCRLTCLLVMAGLSITPAQGTPLPDPVTFADCAVDAVRVGGVSNCTLGSTFASVSLLPFPSVVASTSSPPIDASGTHGSAAQASVVYSFEV